MIKKRIQNIFNLLWILKSNCISIKSESFYNLGLYHSLVLCSSDEPYLEYCAKMFSRILPDHAYKPVPVHSSNYHVFWLKWCFSGDICYTYLIVTLLLFLFPFLWTIGVVSPKLQRNDTVDHVAIMNRDTTNREPPPHPHPLWLIFCAFRNLSI